MVRRKFRRQCFWLKKIGEDSWKKPRGRHSKLRHEKAGRWIVPKVGYGAPNSEKYMVEYKNICLVPIMVSNAKDLEKIDPKKNFAIVSGSVGMKKFLEISAAAEKKGIKVINRKKKSAKAAKPKAEIKKEEKAAEKIEKASAKKKESN